MAKLFSIDHILHGDPPSSSRHNQSLIPSADTAWINSNPLAAYPAIPGYWPAPPSTSIPAPPWFQPVDLMTSLWAAAAASSTTAVAAGSQWIPSTDVYAPSALMDPAGHHHALVYLNAGRAAAGLLQHPSHQPAARKGGQIRFSHRQSHQLEETFNATRYLTPSQRRVLAHRLSLSERQVKTWFQNRRAKWRRTKKEGKLAAEDEDEEISDDAEEDGQQ